MRRIAIYLGVVIVLAAAAVGATYLRYESLSPCDWLEQDMARESGLPPIVSRGQITGAFLLEGITDPTSYQCLLEWWEFRLDGQSPQ